MKLLLAHQLPLLVIVPLAGAVIVSLLRRFPVVADIVSAAASLGTALLSLLALASVLAPQVLTYAVGGWQAPVGILLVVDGFSAFMLVIVNVLVFLAALYSSAYLEHRGRKWSYYTVFLLMLAGLNGVLLSADLFNAFVFLELASVSAYIMAAFDGRGENYEAAFKYAVLGSASSMLILLSIALLYARTSSLSFMDISAFFRYDPASSLASFVALLVIIGFALKATLVPFHVWVPDAYVSAPSPVSALYAGAVSKVLGIYLLVRLLYNIFGVTPLLLNIVAFLGVISIVVGVTLALYQWDFKRLLAYHSISQIGYVMLGIGLGTPLGILGGLFHLLNHSVFKPLLFLNAGSIERTTGTRNLKEMGGLSKRLPVTSFTSMIASLSISGVPPLNGFWSKLIIVLACVAAGRYWFALFAVLASILTLASFLKVQRYAFYGYLKDALRSAAEAPLLMTIPMIVLSLACVFLGILLLPGIDNSFLSLATQALLRGKEYVFLVSGALK